MCHKRNCIPLDSESVFRLYRYISNSKTCKHGA